MLTADDFRDAALSMNDAIEGAHMAHPDFRANGRIFASLSANEETGTFKLTPEEQREVMRMNPKAFAPAAGAWGRQGWTIVRLTLADEGSVRAAMLLAWQGVASLPPRKPKASNRDGTKRKSSRDGTERKKTNRDGTEQKPTPSRATRAAPPSRKRRS